MMSDIYQSSLVTQPLIVITGPTASGKTGLALSLAERYGGEIVCADSRTVYRGMDIGTAKPTPKEQQRVRHHLLDVVEPSTRFTAADFQRLAKQAIADIRQRGKVPFLVGGTGLYIDGVVLDYQFGVPADEARRQQLATMSVQELNQALLAAGIELPENPLNKRQLIRSLEQGGTNRERRPRPAKDTLVVAISTERRHLEVRIRQRAEAMFEGGVLSEARTLGERYGWDSEAMTGSIYPILRQVIEGQLSQKEAIEKFVVSDRRLAKRQVTWLKRHDHVHWLPLKEAGDFIGAELEHRAS